MEITNRIASLFQIKQPQVSPTPDTMYNSNDTKADGETYIYYGTRICGRVTASLPALSAFLPRIFNIEKQRQIADEQLQKAHQRQLQNQLDQIKNEISTKKADITNGEQRVKALECVVEELKGKLIEEKDRHGEVNKMARVKMMIGLTILVILTMYLFIFYSSTFYSAFFKEFDVNLTIGAAMFDPQAIPHALSAGLGELIFILSAPIIFMGLGYGLHYFMQQDSWVKYIKTGMLLMITFFFDAILAYLIAKKIYVIESMMKLGDTPDFNIGTAVSDENVWAVIFCGFIVYMIWGIVFDMTLTAYEDIRSNLKEIKKVEESIRQKNEMLLQEKQSLTAENAKLQALENKQKSLTAAMSQTVHYDTHIIRVALADFFSGWMTMMNTLKKSTTEQEEANQIYQTTINQLFI